MTYDISSIMRKFLLIPRPYFNVSSWHLTCSFSRRAVCEMCYRTVPCAWLHKAAFCCTATACQQHLWGAAVTSSGKWRQKASLWSRQTLSLWGGYYLYLVKEAIEIRLVESLKESLVKTLSNPCLLNFRLLKQERPSFLLAWVMRWHSHPRTMGLENLYGPQK